MTRTVFLIAVVLMTVGRLVSQTWVEVRLNDGGIVEGSLRAIGSSNLLVGTVSGVHSIARNQVVYVLPGRSRAIDKQEVPVVQQPSAVRLDPRLVPLKPLQRKWFSEVETALTFLNPFALRLGYKHWYRQGDHLDIGGGTAFHFYRYAMQNISLHGRIIGNARTSYLRPYFEAEVGMSVYEHLFQSQWFRRQYDFTPVLQTVAGPGFWLDTGTGMVLLIKLAYSATRFKFREEFSPTNRMESKFLIMSAQISTSIIF